VLAVVHDNQQLRVRKPATAASFAPAHLAVEWQGSRELLWHEMRVTLRRQLDDAGAREWLAGNARANRVFRCRPRR